VNFQVGQTTNKEIEWWGEEKKSQQTITFLVSPANLLETLNGVPFLVSLRARYNVFSNSVGEI
jgi:hypothetical protein